MPNTGAKVNVHDHVDVDIDVDVTRGPLSIF